MKHQARRRLIRRTDERQGRRHPLTDHVREGLIVIVVVVTIVCAPRLTPQILTVVSGAIAAIAAQAGGRMVRRRAAD
ncbi:hypothetical protein [Streptomyces sp. MZ04]|uniref:hypothetical protein n=1 Tax=Streptomyces sp. MZ04 TaxID=2559236 RepID=UPI00107EA5D6|nr:hypothetical protein [Streptomyces sp. MZ04]TGB14409.1 hypothetical protein E2651_06175 [Streptomyces sp. MZ04]